MTLRPVDASPSSTTRARDEILTAEALAFLGELHGRFDARRRELLAAPRATGRAGRTSCRRPRDVREADWRVAPPRPDYADRRVEITGPTDRKLVINALNSGAKGFMADFEDANSPTWRNQVEGHANLIDAVEGTITYDASDGRHYALGANPATLLVRPRGWHLPEKHLRVGDEPIAGALVDFGLYAFHNARRLLDRARRRTSTCPRWSTTSRPGCGTRCSRSPQEALGMPHGTHPRHRAHRDAAGRVPDGGDPLRAARPLVRPERRPLGLHLLDDQVLQGPIRSSCCPTAPTSR